MEDRKILDEFTALDFRGRKFRICVYIKKLGTIRMQDDVNEIEKLEFILANGQELEEIGENEFKNMVTGAIYKKALKPYKRDLQHKEAN